MDGNTPEPHGSPKRSRHHMVRPVPRLILSEPAAAALRTYRASGLGGVEGWNATSGATSNHHPSSTLVVDIVQLLAVTYATTLTSVRALLHYERAWSVGLACDSAHSNLPALSLRLPSFLSRSHFTVHAKASDAVGTLGKFSNRLGLVCICHLGPPRRRIERSKKRRPAGAFSFPPNPLSHGCSTHKNIEKRLLKDQRTRWEKIKNKQHKYSPS